MSFLSAEPFILSLSSVNITVFFLEIEVNTAKCLKPRFQRNLFSHGFILVYLCVVIRIALFAGVSEINKN